MGSQPSVLVRNAAGDHVTGSIVNGAVEVTVARKKPLEVPELPR